MAWPSDGDTNWNAAMKAYVDVGHSAAGVPNYAGLTAQVVNTQTGAVNTGTTTIPLDDTIPQITEGDEYMTLAITPKNANNKLRIDVVAFYTHSAGYTITTALFQDATVSALAASADYYSGIPGTVSFSHYMVAGTTSATTFRVRIGSSNAGTLTFNGAGGVRKLGSVLASSITITEIWV